MLPRANSGHGSRDQGRDSSSPAAVANEEAGEWEHGGTGTVQGDADRAAEVEHSAVGGSGAGTMRETSHLMLAVAALGVFLLAAVSAPRVARAAGDAGSFAMVQITPYQRRQQLLSTVETMYGRDRPQRRQQLLSTVSEIDRALGDSEDANSEDGCGNTA
jgi:hypothetical protein